MHHSIPCPPGSIEIRPLGQQDLSAVAQIHLVAFPHSALTALGLEAVRRYYDWQLTGPHDVSALGVCDGNELAGFCIGGVFRGAMSGFLQKHRTFLVWRVATHPWLALNPLFRERLAMGLGVLHRFSRTSKSASPNRTTKQPRFGILSIGVSPKFQGRGVGKLLMTESETIARHRGFQEMQLSVNPENLQAVRFYENLGWQKVIRDNIWTGDMIKQLNQNNQDWHN